MIRLATAISQLALTFWIGGMWVIGYVVAPVLFSVLGDRQLAGLIAGKLFAIIAWVGLGCASYQVIFVFVRRGAAAAKGAEFWLVLVLGILSAVSLFGIQPLMSQLKADAFPRDVMESVLRDRFVAWHGISSILYLIQSLLGIWLVLVTGRGAR